MPGGKSQEEGRLERMKMYPFVPVYNFQIVDYYYENVCVTCVVSLKSGMVADTQQARGICLITLCSM